MWLYVMPRFGVASIGVDMLTTFVTAFCYFLQECTNKFLCPSWF